MIAGVRRNTALFALVSTAIFAFAAAFFRSAIYTAHPDVLAWGLTFDLTLTVPLLYLIIVVRGGRLSAATVAPVFVICVAIAARIVPHGQQEFLHQLRFLAVPLDVVTLWLVARRLASGSSQTLLDRLAASELTMLLYGLLSWHTKPPAGFTVHKRSGWGSVVAAIVVVIVAESIGVHLLLQQWSVRAAWIATALDLYGVLWFFGDYNALRLRPTTIDAGALHLRYGLRWAADVPLANIVAVQPVEGDWKRKGTLKIAMFDEPKLRIQFREPVEARGFGGLVRRTIDAIVILPDEPELFESTLRTLLETP